VIGIIAALVGILMPALSRARQQALSVECKAHLQQVGALLQMYANANRGWVYPVGPRVPGTESEYQTLGFEPLQPDFGRGNRWPLYVEFDPRVWNPALLRCPADFEPAEEHSYVLNKHLAVNNLKMHTTRSGRLTTSEIVVMGEKVSSEVDYYMAAGDFDRIVEPYRHGPRLGSNYLYLDGHVTIVPPNEALPGIDPWAGGLAPVGTPAPPD
jgi:prepilin-type processing-associated H-X9-DG protein